PMQIHAAAAKPAGEKVQVSGVPHNQRYLPGVDAPAVKNAGVVRQAIGVSSQLWNQRPVKPDVAPGRPRLFSGRAHDRRIPEELKQKEADGRSNSMNLHFE